MKAFCKSSLYTITKNYPKVMSNAIDRISILRNDAQVANVLCFCTPSHVYMLYHPLLQFFPSATDNILVYFSAALPSFNIGAFCASLFSSLSGTSCLEYILYSELSLKLIFPLSTCLRVAESLDFGRPIDSRNATAKFIIVSIGIYKGSGQEVVGQYLQLFHSNSFLVLLHFNSSAMMSMTPGRASKAACAFKKANLVLRARTSTGV